MAILVGIDEAGYGPHLGPLVVAAAALEFAGDALPDPDLWSRLRGHVRKRPSGGAGLALVCDSKIAYSGGLAALERTVLGALAANDAAPGCLAALLSATAVAAADENGGLLAPPQPWHVPQDLGLPAAASPEDVAAVAANLTAGLAEVGGRPGALRANVASAARLNRLMAGTGNKARALFALTAEVLADVQNAAPDEPIHVTMDRHGGRRYYAELLASAFPMTPVETIEESRGMSRYCLRRPTAPVHLTIRDRCEAWSLATALASMTAKYIRELHMRQFNAFFQTFVPGLRPTAGYGTDAWRFLAEVEAARSMAGVPDAVILRTR